MIWILLAHIHIQNFLMDYPRKILKEYSSQCICTYYRMDTYHHAHDSIYGLVGNHKHCIWNFQNIHSHHPASDSYWHHIQHILYSWQNVQYMYYKNVSRIFRFCNKINSVNIELTCRKLFQLYCFRHISVLWKTLFTESKTGEVMPNICSYLKCSSVFMY